MPSSEKNDKLTPERNEGGEQLSPERGADRLEEELEVPEDALGTARRLWGAARGQRWRLIVAAVCSVLYVAGSLGATAYSAGLIDMLWNNIQATFETGAPFVVTLENGGLQILTFFGIWTAAWAAYTVQVLVMASFSERLNLGLRARIGKKLSRLPLSYYDAHQPGDTISRATNDLDKVSEVLQRGLLQLLIAVCMVGGAIILMATYDLMLTAVFVAFAIIASVATKLVTARTLKLAAARQTALGDLTGRVEEAYSGRAVIKAFGREEASLAEVGEAADRLMETSASADFVTNAIAPAIRLLMRLCQVTVGLLAGGMLVMGQISVGVFQAFFQYVMQASEPFTQLALTVNMLQGALAAAERVFAFLDEAEVVPDPATPAELPEPVRGRVAFEHVRFGYSADRPLMRDVSLTAEPGQKVAIVGATGAGKTTLTTRWTAVASRLMAWTPVTSPAPSCAASLAWSCRTRGSLREPSRRISPTASPAAPARRWRRPPARRTLTSSCARCRTATTRCSPTMPRTSAKVSVSCSPLHVPCSPTRRSSSSTRPPRAWTPAPSRPSFARWRPSWRTATSSS